MKKNWKETEFTRQVRVHLEDLEWLKTNKGKQSIAGFLSEVISSYKISQKKAWEKAKSQVEKLINQQIPS